MQLIGYMDSPFVRRVAITMQFLGLPYQHRELSIFRDYEEFRAINPMVKVPTLVLDDGQVLIDSGLIIDYLESQLAHRSLMPADAQGYVTASRYVGTALILMEKRAQLYYETEQRPEEKQHGPWIKRLSEQLEGAIDLVESYVSAGAVSESGWLFGTDMTQADISIAVAWRFIIYHNAGEISLENYPALTAFSARAETLPQFIACPLSG